MGFQPPGRFMKIPSHTYWVRSMRTNDSRRTQQQPPERGLTRVEVVAMLAALALLASVALPALANTRSRSERVNCISNLRHIGQALNSWAANHGDRMPWLTPSQEEGVLVTSGSPPPIWNGLQNQLWFHYSWVSNELVLPQYLVCPSDISKVVARNWGSSDPTGGFRYNIFQNNSVSYTLGLHAVADRPQSILAGDRDFGYDALSTTCVTGIVPVREIQPATTTATWQGKLHGGNGNLVLLDGSVEQVDNAGLRKVLLRYPPQDSGGEHFLNPN